MHKSFTVVGLASLLAGCNLAPPHVRPPLPVPDDYPAEVRPGTESRKATEVGWREFFRDPRLQVLIASALENNRDLRVAVARIEEARGQYRIQDAARLPRVDVGG